VGAVLARHRQLFSTAVFALDATVLVLAWFGAYLVRFYTPGWTAPLGVPPVSLYAWLCAVVTPIGLMVLRSFQIYRSARTSRLGEELYALTRGVIIVTALAGLASFFTRGELSRSMLLLFAGFSLVGLCGSRVLIRWALRQVRRHGRNLRHALVVGTGPLAETVVRKVQSNADYGLLVSGIISPAEPAAVREVAGVPVVGAVRDLPAIVERLRIDLVYLALARAEFAAEEEALAQLSDSTAAVRLVPDLARAFTLNASVEDFDGLPVVLVTESPGQGWNALLKRAFDLVFSALGLVVLSPLLLVLAVWVRLDSRGPALYAQERVGLNGRRFRMLKFRTMKLDAEADGAGWTVPGDPRRTRAGTVLRPLSLDELPQLWNVLLGEMSLVGPRPERPVYVEQFRASIPRYMLRHHVKAGITGWAQVHGLRGDTPLESRIEYDLFYIRNWSLGLDLRILWLTVARVFRDASAH
jgi:Undecaprenyl-phosphate glucose phosphotransferase